MRKSLSELKYYRKQLALGIQVSNKIQKKLCTNFLRKTKKRFCKSLTIKKITDIEYIWNAVKRYFTNKIFENENVIEESELA